VLVVSSTVETDHMWVLLQEQLIAESGKQKAPALSPRLARVSFDRGILAPVAVVRGIPAPDSGRPPPPPLRTRISMTIGDSVSHGSIL